MIFITSKRSSSLRSTESKPSSYSTLICFGGGGGTTGSYWVEVKEDLVTLEVQNGQIGRILNDIFNQTQYEYVIYTEVKGQVTLNIYEASLEQVLDFLLNGTEFTYRRDDNVFLIGKKDMKGMISQELITFDYLKVDKIKEIIPRILAGKLNSDPLLNRIIYKNIYAIFIGNMPYHIFYIYIFIG